MLQNTLHKLLSHHLVFHIWGYILVELQSTKARLVVAHSFLCAASLNHLVMYVFVGVVDLIVLINAIVAN